MKYAMVAALLCGSLQSISQNAGIGTSTPRERLEVAGNLLLPTGASLYIGGRTVQGEDGLRLHQVDGNAYIDMRGPGSLNFRLDNSLGGTTRLTLQQNGNASFAGDVVVPANRNFRYAADKIITVSYPAVAFHPLLVSANTGSVRRITHLTGDNRGGQVFSSEGLGTNGLYWALPLHLPQGASIEEIYFYFKDNDNTARPTLEVFRVPITSGIQQVWGINLGANNSEVKDDARLSWLNDPNLPNYINHTIDNETYSYYIRINMRENASFVINGLRLKYKITTVN